MITLLWNFLFYRKVFFFILKIAITVTSAFADQNIADLHQIFSI